MKNAMGTLRAFFVLSLLFQATNQLMAESDEQKRIEERIQEEKLEDQREEQKRIEQQIEDEKVEERHLEDKRIQRKLDDERWDRAHGH